MFGILCIPVISLVHASAPSGTMSSYTLLEPLPDISGGGGTISTVVFKDYVGYAFNLFIALAAVAAVFMIVLGGLQYMSTDAWEGKSAGISKLKNAVLGLLLILCSYLILQTIDPRLVAIPDTIVPPLTGLDYTPVTKSFLAGIDSELSSIHIDNQQILNDINAQRQTVTDLENQKQDAYELYGFADDADYAEKCDPNNGDIYDQTGCTEVAAIIDQQKTAEGVISLKTAQASMNNTLVQCQASSPNGSSAADMSACRSKLLQYRNEQYTALTALGQTAAADQVMNYGVYASTMLDINDTVSKAFGPSSVFTQTIKGSIKDGLYVGGVACGGVVGGLVVGTVGNVLIDAYSSQANKTAAATAVTQINNDVRTNLAQISDSDTKARMISQANSIIHSLGGTPNFQ